MTETTGQPAPPDPSDPHRFRFGAPSRDIKPKIVRPAAVLPVLSALKMGKIGSH